jgi:uncharacterized membrane protein
VFLSLRKCSLLCFLVLPLFSTNKIYLHEKLIQLKYFEKWFYKKEKSSYEMKAIIRFILCFWQLVYLVFFYQLVHFSHEQKKKWLVKNELHFIFLLFTAILLYFSIKNEQETSFVRSDKCKELLVCALWTLIVSQNSPLVRPIYFIFYNK